MVVFSGTDGSGKTTLANRLVQELMDMGIRTEYVWCRHESGTVRAFVKTARFLGGDKRGASTPASGYGIFKGRMFAKPAIGHLYRIFVMMDYLIEVKSRIIRRLRRVDVLVVDRYVMDVAADVTVECNLEEDRSLAYLRTLQKLVPRAGVSFLVTVPTAISLERKDDIPSREYVERRLSAFETYCKEEMVVRIDGTMPVTVTTSSLLSAVLSARDRGNAGGFL